MFKRIINSNMFALVMLVVMLAASLELARATAPEIPKIPVQAQVCSACHGIQGHSIIPGFPNLAGQDEQYLIAQLTAFREQTRTGGQSVIMYGVAMDLSDSDIAIIAKYFTQF